ncbi:hypothetical protein ACLMJK_006734 [Lecanora helva]
MENGSWCNTTSPSNCPASIADTHYRTKPSPTTPTTFFKWYLSSSVHLSFNHNRNLQLTHPQQNVGWFLRKAISMATITLTISEYTSSSSTSSSISSSPPPKNTTTTTTTTTPSSPPANPTPSSSTTSITHIDIKQTATGGISGTTENRTLDWTYRDHKDGIFGAVRGRSRWVKLSELGDEKEWLREGWEGAGEEGAEFVQSWVESVGGGWTADQIWGFEVVGGERRYCRRVIVRKGDDWKLARLVYDYHGAAALAEEDDGLAYE